MSKIRGEQVKDDSLTGDDVNEDSLIVTKLRDIDNDTKVEVELNSDEDKIRFSTSDAERIVVDSDGGVAFGSNVGSVSGPPNSWNYYNFKGGGLHVTGNNFYCDNNKGLLWGDSSVQVKGNALTETLTVKANYNAYIHVDGVNDTVGIGTVTPTSSLHISGTTHTDGGVKWKFSDVSTNTTLTEDQHVIRCVQSSAITLTLPNKAMSSNQVYIIKDALGNAATNNISIIPHVGDAIDGMSSVTINANHGKLTIMCDGINGWMILG
jgi:hypothetical protein